MFPWHAAIKAHPFDEVGNCLDTDYLRMMKIVLDAGYRGYIGSVFRKVAQQVAGCARDTRKPHVD